MNLIKRIKKILLSGSTANASKQIKRTFPSLESHTDTNHGLLLSDRKFFTECLDFHYHGLEKVRQEAAKGRYAKARKALASFIRETMYLEPFLSIPYEEPENIYKYPDETDADACRRVHRHTMISVGIPCDFGITPPIDWHANPTDNGYREWTWQLNRHNELKMLAHEYLQTGEEWLAETAADLLSSWIRQAPRPDETEHRRNQTDCWRTIECGIRAGANWPYALTIFRKSSAFPDDLLVDWIYSMWEHADYLSRFHTSGNWLIMEMNGLAHISILCPFFSLSGQWLSQAFACMVEGLKRQFYPDGFHYELSTNYHDVAINNYQRMILTAQAFHVPVPENMLRTLANACELDEKLMMPDGCLPDINDGARLNVRELFALRRRMLPHNKAILRISEVNSSDQSEYTSVILPYAGFLVMRTDWKPDSTWALFDAAPFGAGHQHEDKLSVLLYVKGKLLLTEGGNYAYDDSDMRRYVLSGRAHNIVRVDGCDQNRRLHYQWDPLNIRKESGLQAHIGSVWDYGKAKYDEGYGNLRQIPAIHERSVFFCKKHKKGGEPFLIVVDRMHSNDMHTYEWMWHIDSILSEKTCRNQGKKLSFSEIDILFSLGEGQIICGQQEPEWQGFISSGITQGAYREAPCVSICAQADNLRMVTVFAPHKEGEADIRFTGIKANPSPDEQGIILYYEDGSWLSLTENELARDL